MPHGEKFKTKPIRGIIVIDMHILSAILSRISIPDSDFLKGNNAKMIKYPGIKRRNGNPRKMRTIPPISNIASGSKVIFKRNNMMRSIGYICGENVFIIMS